jgi:hypothetical protein
VQGLFRQVIKVEDHVERENSLFGVKGVEEEEGGGLQTAASTQISFEGCENSSKRI